MTAPVPCTTCELLREALQWCLDDAGWRLGYYSGESLPRALSHAGGTAPVRIKPEVLAALADPDAPRPAGEET